MNHPHICDAGDIGYTQTLLISPLQSSLPTGPMEVHRAHETLDISMARLCLKSPSHYLVHPLTPPWSHKSQYHGHWWMTQIPFIPCQTTIPFRRWSYFKLWPWNLNTKVMGVVKGQGHTCYTLSYWFASFYFTSITQRIPEIELFQNFILKNASVQNLHTY